MWEYGEGLSILTSTPKTTHCPPPILGQAPQGQSHKGEALIVPPLTIIMVRESVSRAGPLGSLP